MTPVPHEEGCSSRLSRENLARVEELVDQYELARDAGSSRSPEQLCEDAPELLQPLRDALQRLKSVDAKLASVPSVPLPTRIGEFQVVELLGTGATGMVFRCRQKNPNRDVAVKVLKPTLDVDDQQKRFQREMAVFGAIREEGIAEVYQSGIVDWCGVRCFWIAMELLDQSDICGFLKKNPRNTEQILRLFGTLCRTLRAAHRLGILHRDIKPSNILMSCDGMPHLVDFGIARLPAAIPGAQSTEIGMPSHRGTTAWMAPELLMGNHSTRSDVRTEIFSLGLVLYEMLTGQHPYGAETLTTGQVAVRIAQRQPDCFRTLCPEASPDLVAFLNKMMEFSADDRYQNLDDVLSDLERLQSGEPVRVRVVSIPEWTWRWCRKHLTPILLGLALVGLLTMTITAWRYAASAETKANLATEEARQANEKIRSARKTAGLHLRLLKEQNVNPAMVHPQKPGDLAQQLQQLREARETFEEYLVSYPKDREIRESAGTGFHLLGIAACRLELFDESRESFHRAEQIFADLQRDYPENDDYVFDIFSTALGQSGAILGTQESFELHRYCLRLIRGLCAEQPHNMDYADAMACVLVELGLDYTRSTEFQNLTTAREHAMEAHELAKSICRRPDFNPLHRKHIATSASVLRAISVREGNHAESLEWSRISVREQTLFMQDFPDRDSRAVLVNYQIAEAQDLLELGKVADARIRLNQASSRFEELRETMKDHPVLPDLQKVLSTLATNVQLAENAVQTGEDE